MKVREEARSWGAALRLGFSTIVHLPSTFKKLLRQLDRQEATARIIIEQEPARSVDEALKQMVGVE